jgi:chromosome segregation ATPase
MKMRGFTIYTNVKTDGEEGLMAEEVSGIQGATIAVETTGVDKDSPFDRLEERIDSFIERYEQLRSEHNSCSEQLAEREARISQLEAQLENLERQRSEMRTRLDALIDKLGRFS